MRLGTSLFSHWGETHMSGYHDFSDPDCPTPESLDIRRRAARPLDLTFSQSEFFYYAAEGHFYDEDGRRVTGEQILDYLYDYHCQKLHRWFRAKMHVRNVYEHAVRGLLREVQRGAGWLLEHGYDIQSTVPQKDYRFLFHTHSFADFKRLSDDMGTHFFGFITSRRGLFANLLLLAVTCIAACRYLPRGGFFTAVYRNAPLTTAGCRPRGHLSIAAPDFGAWHAADDLGGMEDLHPIHGDRFVHAPVFGALGCADDSTGSEQGPCRLMNNLEVAHRNLAISTAFSVRL
jgi:hypothetical protein